jgi:hypothetical protein
MSSGHGLTGGDRRPINQISTIMTAQGTNRSTPAPEPHSTYDLSRIGTDGPDCLDIHDVPGLIKASLSEAAIAWPGADHHTATIKADNLLRPNVPPVLANPLFPQGGQITSATFQIQTATADKPHWVHVSPPHTLELEDPGDAPVVHDFFLKRRIEVLLNAVATAIALLLAAAIGLCPDIDPIGQADDDDDDDNKKQHYCCTHSRPFRSLSLRSAAKADET